MYIRFYCVSYLSFTGAIGVKGLNMCMVQMSSHGNVLCVNAGLTDFLSTLDERYNNKVKKDGTAMARKQRKIGAPSVSRPPSDAPQWVIDQQWKGVLHMHYCAD